ncbi:HAD-superfamily hydrolase [Lophium mytilinum]|uniref:HAD-superfamily hydrolase n=1 Tax=Lophium mytilinum TaxID=390894 RepID=A0A6A6QZ05_9PEZI|nr:HAD-superfamily hydrolase [Lophium mytilinum]
MTLVPSSTPFSQFRLLTFDIYGTLIDQETGIVTALLSSPHISKLPSSHPFKSSRSELLNAFKKHEHPIQKSHPTLLYKDVLARTYKRLVEDLISTSDTALGDEPLDAAAEQFGASIKDWQAFPDTVPALKSLAKHFKLAPLSNIDNASLKLTLENGLAGASFDTLYTAEDIGSYKPDLRNFEYLIKHAGEDFAEDFGIGKGDSDEVMREKVKGQLLHVAMALFHDHVPAKALKLESVWVDREVNILGRTMEGEDIKEKASFGWHVHSLGELAAMVEEQLAK